MSDLVPGTMIRLRITRRFSHYNVGDEIALAPADAAKVVRSGNAIALDMLVPTPPAPPPRATMADSLVRK